MKVVLFLNGLFPKDLPNTNLYDFIFCTDGAYNTLKAYNIKPHIISGDLDSIDSYPSDIEVIKTPDQNFTDFEKALEIIVKKGGTNVDIYGGSGKEQDHFLGNLFVALKFEKKLSITFYDNFHYYFVTSKNISFKTQIGKIISLFPYPSAKNVITEGLKYPLFNETLDLKERIGTRNIALKTTIKITFTEGSLIVFIEKD